MDSNCGCTQRCCHFRCYFLESLSPWVELEIELLVEVVVGLHEDTVEDLELSCHLSHVCILAVLSWAS